MKTLIKTMAGLLVAAVMPGVTAFCQDNSQMTWPPTAWDWPGNNFTNKVVVPTVDFYAKTQAAVANDQQYRVRQEGGTAKGSAGLLNGPRIEPRPPTTYVQADPWVQRDHPWDVNPYLPINESPGSTNSSIIDETRRR
ncbi:MAG TPA: hypothetical protein VNV43_01950 [Candidatus Acidoferrales bacterium]|jgi:hypothetical protein|nr:hypothetical protein [Candidatus Acidoferrales bacterium]